MLVIAMITIALLSSLLLIMHHHRYQQQQIMLDLGRQVSSRTNRLFPVGIALLILALTTGVYSQLGRFHDWDQGQLDSNIDYLVAAEITKARLVVNERPNDEIALLDLAQAYSAGGMYRDAVTTLEQLLVIQGEEASTLGLLATAMYYQDARFMTQATQAVIARALAVYPQEMHSQMLLATHAYFQQDYQQAIYHWQLVLTNTRQAVNVRAINNAILNSQSKLNSSALPLAQGERSSEQNTKAANN